MAKGMKKSAGPKEAAMRAQRESGASDATDILKQIEADEREAYAAFEQAQKEKREKSLAAVIDPLRKKRADAAEAWTEAAQKIKDIDADIARLLGRKVTHGAAPDRGGKRQRLTEAQQIEAADAIVKIVYAAGDEGVARSGLEEKVSPFPSKIGTALKDFVNAKTTSGKKIKIRGEKAASRYTPA